MDDGEPFIDDVISDGFFGHENEVQSSAFSWADDFISSAEGDEGSQPSSTIVQQNPGIEANTHPSSVATLSSQQAPVISSQNFVLANSSCPIQVTNQTQGIQFVQHPVQNVIPASSQALSSIPNLIGSNAQLIRAPNGQLILKSMGGQIQVQQNQSQIHTIQQVGSSGAAQLQQLQGTIINRSLTPNQSPIPISSPLVSRAVTPASSPLVSRSVTPLQSSASNSQVTVVSSKNQGQQQQQLLSNIAGSQNVNLLQIQGNTQSQLLARNIQLQSANVGSSGLNLQGQTFLQGQGILQGNNQATVLQQGHGQTAVLQGQGQTAVLPGHGQNIVNTQNTVIQNPNVVNLNVAHVLCNNSNLQNQQGGTVHHVAPNIPGTLIQTADGKNIIIPSQQLQPGQSINLQNLQQVIQPQLNVAQSANTGATGLIPGTAVIGGNMAVGGLGNMIRLATNQNVQSHDKTNTTANSATHFIGVNQQGQQILIQRAQTPNQQQNIVVRTLNPQNVLQIQQPTGSSGISTSTSQLQQSHQGQVTQQPLLVQSQQQGIQLQRVITASQGQQVKVVGQPAIQNASMPLTLNLGSNIGFQNLSGNQIQAVQLLQQQLQKSGSSEETTSALQFTPQPVASTLVTDSTGRQTQQQAPSALQQQMLTVSPAQNNSTLQQIKTSAMPQVDSLVQSSPQQLAQTLQNIQIPMSQISSSANHSSASSSIVTSTVTQSNIYSLKSNTISNPNIVQAITSVPKSFTVSSANSPQQQKQVTLQARSNAPKLQAIQLTPEAQQQMQAIKAEFKKLTSLKSLTPEQKTKYTNLMEMQKKILTMGQVQIKQEPQMVTSVKQEIVTTDPVIQSQNLSHQNMLTPIKTSQVPTDQSKPTQPVQITSQLQQTPNLIGQNLQQIKTNQQVLSSQPQLTVQPVVNQPRQVIIQTSSGSTATASNIQSQLLVPPKKQQSVGQILVSPVSSASASSSLIQALTSSTTATNASVSNLTQSVAASQSSQSQGSLPTQIQIQPNQSASVLPSGGQVVSSDQVTSPGKVPIPATNQVAVPTQIKIGNNLLNLSLTPAQKEKIQGYLTKMTPEQQQQQLAIFLKLQQQQQYQAQVQAQVRQSLQRQQQAKIPTPVQNLSTTGKPSVLATAKPPDTSQTIYLQSQSQGKVVYKPVSVASIPKHQLIHQQLSKDQENALKPDTSTPFRNKRDLYRRLLRYHVYQKKHPPEKLFKKDEKMFENVAAGLTRKSDAMFHRFRLLILKESMHENRSGEMVMIQRLLNEDLKETIAREKRQVAEDTGEFIPMPQKMLVKTEILSKAMEPKIKEEVDDGDHGITVKMEKDENSNSEDIESAALTSVKMEEGGNSRPSTPKVKLVIRNDGKKFTSSFTELSDTEEESDKNLSNSNFLSDYHDNHMTVEQSGANSLLDDVNIRHIKDEPIEIDDNMDDSAPPSWHDINMEGKQFSHYMETDAPENQYPSDTCNDFPASQTDTVSSRQSSIDSNGAESLTGSQSVSANGVLFENNNRGEHDVFMESDEAVKSLVSAEDEGCYSSDKYHSNSLSVNRSYQHNFPYSSNVSFSSQLSDNKPVSPSEDKSDFDLQHSNLSEGSISAQDTFSNSYPQKHGSYDQCSPIQASLSHDHSESTSNFMQASSIAQYEPISSPEGDHDDSFSSFAMHKVDSRYSVNIGEQKYDSTGVTQNPIINGSSVLRAETGNNNAISGEMDVVSEDTSNSWEEDPNEHSESDQEQSEDVFKAQMQSAIDSILSLNSDSSPHPSASYQVDQLDNYQHGHIYGGSMDTTLQNSSPEVVEDNDDDNTEDSTTMDDDLDAAVKSILM